MSYQYDVLGRRTQLVANGQQPVTYGYDVASRLTQVAQGSLAVGLGYDNANRRTSLTYPNGTSTSYTYDVASRLTNINHTGPSGLIEALTYVYDPAGNRTSLTRNNAAASLLPAAVASATYDAANEQTAFAGATLTYDANGNLTNDGTNTYVWDARNRLVSITGGTTASFHYDVLGRRVHKTRSTPSPALSTGFLYDGNDIAAEIGGSAVGASYLRSLNIDEPFVRQAGTGNEFYHTDALGSSLVLSNSQGATGTMYTYEPFGKTTITGTSANAFQYTGRENDGTGLVYYRTRYYSPYMHRFTREDPIGFSAGPNFYTYVSNRPTQFIDPWGLDPRSKIGFTWGYTWGTNGQQCTFSLACKPTTTFPPAFQLTPIQISYNQPPPHLNPLNVNVNIYNHPIKINGSQPIAGFGVGASVGTYIYENQNPGPGGQTFQQQGFTLGVDIGIAPIVSISR